MENETTDTTITNGKKLATEMYSYVFPEEELGMFHNPHWKEVGTYDVELKDKVSGKLIPLCELDPVLFRNVRMRTYAEMVECNINSEFPLFGMLIEDELLKDDVEILDDNGEPLTFKNSYNVTSKQVEFLGVSERQLQTMKPMIFVYHNKDTGYTAMLDAPLLMWQGKAVNITRAELLPRIII